MYSFPNARKIDLFRYNARILGSPVGDRGLENPLCEDAFCIRLPTPDPSKGTNLWHIDKSH